MVMVCERKALPFPLYYLCLLMISELRYCLWATLFNQTVLLKTGSFQEPFLCIPFIFRWINKLSGSNSRALFLFQLSRLSDEFLSKFFNLYNSKNPCHLSNFEDNIPKIICVFWEIISVKGRNIQIVNKSWKI